MRLYAKGELVSNHFKRQNRRSTKGNIITKLIIIVMILILAYFIRDILNNNKQKDYNYKEVAAQVKKIEEKQEKIEVLKEEADLGKVILENSTKNAERFVTEVDSEIEYTTYKELGNKSISSSRTTKDAGWWTKTFNESSIEVNFDYKALLGISTVNIHSYTSNGTAYIEYDPNLIEVKCVESSSPTTSSKKDMFGKKYSNQDVLSLVDLAKEDIYSELNKDTEIKSKSCTNLNDYFRDLASKFGVDNLVINNEEIIQQQYKFIDLGTVKYNHPNKGLQSIDYIVIHATACEDITALDFYNRLNTSQTDRGTSAHIFVDDKNVVQCLPLNMQAWHCGTKNPKIPVTNQNSIGLEICVFSDPEKQQKAIDNAAIFVNEILKKQYPQIKVVLHRSVGYTLCPSILSDQQFEELFLK